jgi:hypothetical protein
MRVREYNSLRKFSISVGASTFFLLVGDQEGRVNVAGMRYADIHILQDSFKPNPLGQN